MSPIEQEYYARLACEDSERYRQEEEVFGQIQSEYFRLVRAMQDRSLLGRSSANREICSDVIAKGGFNQDDHTYDVFEEEGKAKGVDPDAQGHDHNGDSSNLVDAKVEVKCGEVQGTLFLDTLKVICNCRPCREKPATLSTMTCTRFEAHAGASSAKKWKSSLKVIPGSHPLAPASMQPMSVGKWMELSGHLMHQKIRRAFKIDSAELCGDEDAGAAGTNHDAGGSHLGIKNDSCNEYHREHGMRSAPWRDSLMESFNSIRVQWSPARCAVCHNENETESNRFVMCQSCCISVHQDCYGVSKRDAKKPWTCKSCQYIQSHPSAFLQCCLCPYSGGALKPTTMLDIWCHLSCAQWVPGVTVENFAAMEPITGIRSVPRQLWDVPCEHCRVAMGAKIQCSKCTLSYHPLCARAAGGELIAKKSWDSRGPTTDTLLCPKHKKSRGVVDWGEFLILWGMIGRELGVLRRRWKINLV